MDKNEPFTSLEICWYMRFALMAPTVELVGQPKVGGQVRPCLPNENSMF